MSGQANPLSKQLPNSPYVTACEAMCWLAIGDALNASDIIAHPERKSREGQKPKRELSDAQLADIRSAGRKLIEACAAGRVTLIGRSAGPVGLGDPEKIPSHFLTAAVILDPISNSIVPDAEADFAVFERNAHNLTHWEEVAASTSDIRSLAESPTPGLTAREQQIRAIEEAAKQLKFALLSIPDGGKGRIRKICERDTKLFIGATSFDHAWKAASKDNRIRVANYERHKPPVSR